MKITESRLREIIRSIINESSQVDIDNVSRVFNSIKKNDKLFSKLNSLYKSDTEAFDEKLSSLSIVQGLEDREQDELRKNFE